MVLVHFVLRFTKIISLSFVDMELELPKRLYAEGLEPQVEKPHGIYQEPAIGCRGF